MLLWHSFSLSVQSAFLLPNILTTLFLYLHTNYCFCCMKIKNCVTSCVSEGLVSERISKNWLLLKTKAKGSRFKASSIFSFDLHPVGWQWWCATFDQSKTDSWISPDRRVVNQDTASGHIFSLQWTDSTGSGQHAFADPSPWQQTDIQDENPEYSARKGVFSAASHRL